MSFLRYIHGMLLAVKTAAGLSCAYRLTCQVKHARMHKFIHQAKGVFCNINNDINETKSLSKSSGHDEGYCVRWCLHGGSAEVYKPGALWMTS